ncbi:MAG: site-specific integrase, partial [Verrucomicrobiae bacterium]|nr:site-specific integrase [Verrucomicrobiae bacterium]
MKAKTLNEYLAHVRSFLGWLEERRRIAVNPLRVVKPLRVVTEDTGRAFSLPELQSLVASVPEYRALLYRVAAFTGLRRNELKRLEWSRVVFNMERPRIELAAPRTKSKRPDPLPIHPEAFSALQRLRELSPVEEPMVFFRGVTQMPRFRKDLAAAGIADRDSRGRQLEFHSFRRTLATFLNSAGVAPRLAMELMRHRDMRLTMRDYTDRAILPAAEALASIPSLKSSPISSLKIGKTCPNLSTAEQSEKIGRSAQTAERVGIGADLAGVVQPCPFGKMADREGFEPSVPLQVHTLSRRAHS